jgi:hypothetical protein
VKARSESIGALNLTAGASGQGIPRGKSDAGFGEMYQPVAYFWACLIHANFSLKKNAFALSVCSARDDQLDRETLKAGTTAINPGSEVIRLVTALPLNVAAHARALGVGGSFAVEYCIEGRSQIVTGDWS